MKLKKTEKKMVNLRVPIELLDKIRKNSKKYAEGNLTRWVIYSSLNHRPEEKAKITNS